MGDPKFKVSSLALTFIAITILHALRRLLVKGGQKMAAKIKSLVFTDVEPGFFVF